MNEELKFRSWDKKNKVMIYNIQNKLHTNRDGSRLVGYKGRSFEDFLNDKNMIVMQYTGQKDSESIEIYKQDIVMIKQRAVCKNEKFKYYPSGKFREVKWITQVRRCSWNIGTNSNCYKVVGHMFKNKKLLQ